MLRSCYNRVSQYSAKQRRVRVSAPAVEPCSLSHNPVLGQYGEQLEYDAATPLL